MLGLLIYCLFPPAEKREILFILVHAEQEILVELTEIREKIGRD